MASKNEPKTQPTNVSLEDFIATVLEPERRKDCEALVRLMQAATGEKGCMWGTSIVGFGTYRYEYASGGGGAWPIVGFSPRKNDLTLYIMPGFEAFEALLAKLGKHKTGKSCLYVKRLSELDTAVLEQIVRGSVAAMEPKRVRKAGSSGLRH